MKKLTPLQTRKRLVLSRQSSGANCRLRQKSSSEKSNNQLPVLCKQTAISIDTTHKDIKTRIELIEHDSSSSLSKKNKENMNFSNERKKSISNTLNNHSGKHIRRSIQLKIKDSNLEDILFSLIRDLKAKSGAFQMQEHFCTIQKTYFVQLLQYIISLTSSQYSAQSHKIYRSLAVLRGPMDQIFRYSKQHQRLQKATKLSIKSNIVQVAYGPADFSYEINTRRQQLELYELQKRRIQIQLMELGVNQQKMKVLDQQFKNKLIAKVIAQREVADLYEKIDILQKQRKEKAQQIEEIAKQAKNIYAYVQIQENRKLLRLVSQDYKEIESDIYEFAVYLQSNELASSLNYEPLPFEQLENEVYEEMRQANRTIIQNNSLMLQQKYATMRDYIIKTLDYFKIKDRQLVKMCDFKTRCIKTFVSNMKKWLGNWQLKQEFLVNLRKEFVVDSAKINNLLREMQEEEMCSKCCKLSCDYAAKLSHTFSKIEENYKLGNSFY